MDENMECQYHNQCGGWCETEEERDQCLCCDCLDAEREEDAERQHAVELGKAMQRIACAAGIELMQPKEIADIVCGRLREAVAAASAEREACAKLCDDMTTGDRVSFDWERGASDCAHAIRARNQPPKGRDYIVNHFNQLTPAEAERLALLSEELGECTQAIGKILRHGYESRHPNGGPTNREALEKEVADVLLAIRLLLAAGDMDQIRVTTHECMKAEAVRKYLHHQPPKGEG